MIDIDFIAWDTELKFFVDTTKYLINMNGKVFFNNDGYIYDQTNKLALMQYTGIKDDNEEKIYEGFVVRLELSVPDGYDEYKRIVIESEIKYVRCSFCYKHGRNWVELDYDKSDGESCVIIGNIYEK